MNKDFGSSASDRNCVENLWSACDRSRRKLAHRVFKRADGQASLFRLTVRCAADDAAAVKALVQAALAENLIAERHGRMSKASGKQFRELDLIVRCPSASRRSVMAVMGRLEHETLVRGVVWESLPNSALGPELDDVSDD
jgi:hypothetical protein